MFHTPLSRVEFPSSMEMCSGESHWSRPRTWARTSQCPRGGACAARARSPCGRPTARPATSPHCCCPCTYVRITHQSHLPILTRVLEPRTSQSGASATSLVKSVPRPHNWARCGQAADKLRTQRLRRCAAGCLRRCLHRRRRPAPNLHSRPIAAHHPPPPRSPPRPDADGMKQPVGGPLGGSISQGQ